MGIALGSLPPKIVGDFVDLLLRGGKHLNPILVARPLDDTPGKRLDRFRDCLRALAVSRRGSTCRPRSDDRNCCSGTLPAQSYSIPTFSINSTQSFSAAVFSVRISFSPRKSPLFKKS